MPWFPARKPMARNKNRKSHRHHDRNSRVYCVSCACWRDRRATAGADAVERRLERTRCRCRGRLLQSAASTRWPSVWPSGNEADAGGNPICGERVQETPAARLHSPMPWPAQLSRRQRAAPRRRPKPHRDAASAAHGQGGARRNEKGTALVVGLQEAFLGRHHGGGELGDGAQACVVIGGDGTVGVDEEHRHRRSRRLRPINDGEPRPQRFAASLMSPASTAHSMPDEYGKRADRIGRRQPRPSAGRARAHREGDASDMVVAVVNDRSAVLGIDGASIGLVAPRRGRAACSRSHGRAGCAGDADDLHRRRDGCRYARRAAPARGVGRPAISNERLGVAVTRTMAPSSSRRPSPSAQRDRMRQVSRKDRATLAGQPMRRRWRPWASSVTQSIASRRSTAPGRF